jgi:polyisoprenoid-binding protein YceI
MKLAYAPLVLVAGVLTLSGPAYAADYVIDTKGNHASINFRIKHLGFSWLTGRFDKFSGNFSYDKTAPEAAKVKVEIDTASLNSNHAERDKHIKSADFLDAAKFPKATFESTSVKANGEGKATITGRLTLHGVTKDVVIEAEHVGGGNDPWGGVRDGFAGKTTLTLADFDIDTAKLGPSSAKVDLELNIEGIKQ